MTKLNPPTLDWVCNEALRLPCSPTLLPRLIATLQQEDSTATEIEQLIRLDSALAVATLRLANSAALGVGREVSTACFARNVISGVWKNIDGAFLQ